MATTVRIDKWLWAVRLYKTRSLAAESVKLGRVLMDGQPIKPSRAMKLGDVVEVRSTDLLRTVRIKALAEKRMGAKLVPDFLEDLTPPQEWERYRQRREEQRLTAPAIEHGLGRPTKQHRRELDDFLGSVASAAALTAFEGEDNDADQEDDEHADPQDEARTRLS